MADIDRDQQDIARSSGPDSQVSLEDAAINPASDLTGVADLFDQADVERSYEGTVKISVLAHSIPQMLRFVDDICQRPEFRLLEMRGSGTDRGQRTGGPGHQPYVVRWQDRCESGHSRFSIRAEELQALHGQAPGAYVVRLEHGDQHRHARLAEGYQCVG